MYYLQSRYYDPETGRFLNADDVGFIGYSGEQLSYNAFAYCENNAVKNYDPLGSSWLDTIKNMLLNLVAAVSYLFATNTVTALSIYDTNKWVESSKIMANDLMKAAGAKSITVQYISAQSFVERWDNIRSKYVIIHSHGSPSSILDDGDPQQTIFTTSDMYKLKRNNKIKCVIIIACSVAGTPKNNLKNFASSLSEKINPRGVVVGSICEIGGNATSFEPLNEFSYISMPWNIYRNGAFLNGALPRTITMKIVYDYLVNHNYL